MKQSTQFFKRAILLIVIIFLLSLSILGLQDGLTAANLLAAIKKMMATDKTLIIITGVALLQLIAMRWSGFVIEQLLTIFSVLLFMEMTTIAMGPGIAMTNSIHELAAGIGMSNPFKTHPALYWLIPLIWFLSLLGARHQVRCFCLALFSYVIWLVFTPIFSTVLTKQAANDSAWLQHIRNLLAGTDWMPALILGCFLLLFSFFVSLLDTLFPQKTPQRS